MPGDPKLPGEIYLDCWYKPTVLGFYDIKFDNSNIRFTTHNENLILLEPEKEGEWKKGLVGMMVAEERGDRLVVCLTDVLKGKVERILVPKDLVLGNTE